MITCCAAFSCASRISSSARMEPIKWLSFMAIRTPAWTNPPSCITCVNTLLLTPCDNSTPAERGLLSPEAVKDRQAATPKIRRARDHELEMRTPVALYAGKIFPSPPSQARGVVNRGENGKQNNKHEKKKKKKKKKKRRKKENYEIDKKKRDDQS